MSDYSTCDGGPVEMSNDKMRDEFDLWIEQRGMSTMKDGETYYHHVTHAAWQAWKASRAASAVQVEPVGYVSPRLLDILSSGKACGITMEDKPDAHNGVTIPLYTALRQYQHNDGSGLVLGYDKLLVDRHVAELVEALEQIAAWPDGGNRYGQANIKRFAAKILASYRKGGES